MLRLLKAIMTLVLEEIWKTTTAVRKANIRDDIWSRDLQNTIKEHKIQILDGVDDLLRWQQLDYADHLLLSYQLVVLYVSTAIEFVTCVIWGRLTALQGVVFRWWQYHCLSENITTDFLKIYQNNVIWRRKYRQVAKCKHTVPSSG